MPNGIGIVVGVVAGLVAALYALYSYNERESFYSERGNQSDSRSREYNPPQPWNLNGKESTQQRKRRRPLTGERCAICFNLECDYETPCVHMFHLDCISKWSKEQKNCPVCRSPLREVF
uniref:RING-type domain-containing protein n=1 Tax=Clastoptera arizonana TaxID=38151 RepID=A0A1B6DHN9_9HEMI